jgi:hypothetical protein
MSSHELGEQMAYDMIAHEDRDRQDLADRASSKLKAREAARGRG